MEIWKDIKFYHPLQNIEYDYTGHYQVSNYGRVRSLKSNGKILKPHKQKRPAGKIDLQITLCKECQKNRFMISRLVAFMFIENKYPFVPVLYVIGMFFKSVEIIKDKYIPVLTWACSIIICFCYFGINVEAFIQATLVAGVTNFASQLYIQAFKKDKK